MCWEPVLCLAPSEMPYMHYLVLIRCKMGYLYFEEKYTEAGKIKWHPTDGHKRITQVPTDWTTLSWAATSSLRPTDTLVTHTRIKEHRPQTGQYKGWGSHILALYVLCFLSPRRPQFHGESSTTSQKQSSKELSWHESPSYSGRSTESLRCSTPSWLEGPPLLLPSAGSSWVINFPNDPGNQVLHYSFFSEERVREIIFSKELQLVSIRTWLEFKSCPKFMHFPLDPFSILFTQRKS